MLYWRNVSSCSGVEVDDKDAQSLYQIGCEHNDAYSCTRLGQYFELNREGKAALAQYDKACRMHDKYGCEFAQTYKDEQTKLETEKAAANGERLHLPVTAVGMVNLRSADANTYQVEILFPLKMVEDSSPQPTSLIKDLGQGKHYPIKVYELEIFDDAGPLARLKVDMLNPIMFCENDGGPQWAPGVTVKIDKKQLSRTLKPQKGRPVAFAKLASARGLPILKGVAKNRKNFAYGRDTNDSALKVVYKVTLDSEMDQDALVTAKGRFDVGCPGP